MAAFAKAFNREKPHSSITDWVDILTADSVAEEAYDGIPELVDSINLQAAGPTEASRAIRKKLKHGRPHQQYRAVVILKALVENCGHKFQTTFADGQLIDTIKNLANDQSTDKKVKKKLLLVLVSWQDQFKSQPSMSNLAGIYKQVRHDRDERTQNLNTMGLPDVEVLEREAKRKAKQERERAKEKERLEEAERRRREKERKNRPKRAPFDFEKEKPLVLGSIVEASQASSNLVNAITLVNQEKESLLSNERVQECLAKAKQARKPVVRYIQLVENEELIGTLIEANDRIINALEMYDKLSTPAPSANSADAVATGLAGVHLNPSESVTELNKLQEKQRAAVARAKQNSYRGKAPADDDGNLHPDLQDLSFGALGSSSQHLPEPLRPSTLSDDEDTPEAYTRGSLSDFSDYDSSDEGTHNAAGSSKTRDYVTVSDDEAGGYRGTKVGSPVSKGALVDVDDPFADPFAG
ncbi:VHS domain protein [Mycena venus]|uniref:VHS domain protein n=1 Tax=Mycena venus TaxID=2733690 RepID=A0A8H6XWE1_9AGAR|nr:VHS domain protein [Mycena venus]